MKKYIFTLAMLIGATTLTACYQKQEVKPTVDHPEGTIEVEELVPQTKFDSLVPDPEEFFLNAEFEMLTSEDGYTIYISEIEPKEWTRYLEECELEGYWTKETFRSDYSWYVDSSDDLYTLLLDCYGENNNYMTIIINKKED